MHRGEARLDLAVGWDEAIAQDVVAAHADLEGAMLPMLHALQERFGYVDQRAIPLIAKALNVSKAEVHGVVTFYHDFHTAPHGAHVLKVCRAESCQSMGCNGLLEHLSDAHGLRPGETTPDGRLSIEAVYCLGNCSLSPAALVDGELVGRLDAARLDTIVHDLSGGRA